MTTQEANDTRKGLVGKQAYIAWRKYMKTTNNVNCNAENFEMWDADHNFGALRGSFGPDEYLIGIAVRLKFNSILTQYSSMKLNFEKGGSKVGFKGLRRGSDGQMWPVEDMNDNEAEFQIKRLKMEIKNTATRLHGFQHDWALVQETVSGWLFELESDDSLKKVS